MHGFPQHLFGVGCCGKLRYAIGRLCAPTIPASDAIASVTVSAAIRVRLACNDERLRCRLLHPRVQPGDLGGGFGIAS